jgi:hypothetical protein
MNVQPGSGWLTRAARPLGIARRRAAGKEKNWIQTVPGKEWNTILRLCRPLEPWFNKTWRPGEIEALD